MAKPVVIVGSSNIDLVMRVPHIPRPGESIHGSGFLMVPGGKGANQAVTAAKLGANACMVTRTGDDVFATTSFASYAAAGLDTSQIVRDPSVSTGVALILVDDHGQNALAVAPQANAYLSQADIDRARSTIEHAGVLLTQQEVPLATTIYALEIARAAGVTTIHNPAPAFGRTDPALLRLVDIITPNQDEAEKLTGVTVQNAYHAGQAAGVLLRSGTSTVVITLGEHGAYYAAANGLRGFVPAFKVEAVDTTAAGDSFNGGLAVALTRGMALPDAVRFACAVAAITVTRMGAQPSLPTGAEVERFLAAQ